MPRSTVLWVDLRRFGGNATSAALRAQGASAGPIALIQRASTGLVESLQQAKDRRPLVVDMDNPGQRELDLVRRCKLACPRCPIIVLLEQCAPAVILWMQRMRIWNAVFKPCNAQQLAACIVDATRLVNVRGGDAYSQPICEYSGQGLPPRLVSAKSTASTAAAIDHIAAHCGSAIRLETLATLCGLSNSEFSRRFRKEHGENFRDYLLRMRIAKAKELLARPDQAISDIAFETGFASAAHFASAFRQQVGMSPSAYRRGVGESRAEREREQSLAGTAKTRRGLDATASHLGSCSWRSRHPLGVGARH